jgi:hypothetical protein
MAKKRQPMMLAAVGRKGVGKTIETIKFIYQYIQGNSTMKARKALIFDVNNEFSSFEFPDPVAGMVRHSIKRIAIKDIPKFSNSNICEVRRVAPYWDNNEAMTNTEYSVALEKILSYYRNGLLLLEDINKYTSENMKADLIGRIISNRHIGIDIVLHFQGIGRILTPKILSNTNIIRLHKTNDQVARYKDRAEDKVHILSIAENIVNNRYDKGDKYFSILVTDDNKIISDNNKDITIKEAEISIIDYLSSKNGKSIIDSFYEKRDLKGNRLMTIEQSYVKAKEKYLKDYFDF